MTVKGEIPEGIGGWLLLPAIGFIIGIPAGFLGLMKIIGAMEKMTNAGGAGSYAVLSMFFTGGMLILTCFAAVKFFKKERGAPRFIIILLFIGFIGSFLLFLIGMSVLRGGSHMQLALLVDNNFIAKGIALMIWGLYFKHSKRVAATFIN